MPVNCSQTCQTIRPYCERYVFHVFIDWYLLFYGFLNSTSLQGTLYVCLIPILFYADRKFLTDAFEKFVYVFSITLAFSIIQFILVQILGISMPAKSIQPLNKAKQASYLAYTFYVTTNQWGADILPRFSAITMNPA